MTHNVIIQIKRLARDSSDTDQVVAYGFALPPNVTHTREKAEETRTHVLNRLGNDSGVYVHSLTPDNDLKTTFVNPHILTGCLASVTLLED